jgi:hypothetical protein
MPDWVVKQLRSGVFNPGLGLQARLVSARITVTADQTCDNGAATRTTTTVARITHARASLVTLQPTIDLIAKRGTSDIDPAWTVLRDGVIRLSQAAYGAGDVETQSTGTDCSGMDETGSVPAPVSRTEQTPVTQLLGVGIDSAIDSHHSIPVRITRSGGTSLTGTYRLDDYSRRQDGESFKGTLHINLRFGGPPIAQQALCQLPMQRVQRVRSLGAARALLRPRRVPEGSVRWVATVWLPPADVLAPLRVGSGVLRCATRQPAVSGPVPRPGRWQVGAAQVPGSGGRRPADGDRVQRTMRKPAVATLETPRLAFLAVIATR